MENLSYTNFVPLADKRYDAISAKIRETFPNACVSYVYSIENPTLIERYEKKRTSHPNGITEVDFLFHGTTPEACTPIILDGFKMEMNCTSAYGRGTYLSKHAKYSRNYARSSTQSSTRNTSAKDSNPFIHMFVCSALVGRTAIFPSNQKIDLSIADSGIDSIDAPSMYIIPDDERVIPRYIIGLYPFDEEVPTNKHGNFLPIPKYQRRKFKSS